MIHSDLCSEIVDDKDEDEIAVDAFVDFELGEASIIEKCDLYETHFSLPSLSHKRCLFVSYLFTLFRNDYKK